jgi:ABC-type lipoprotein export system ATPase subunit
MTDSTVMEFENVSRSFNTPAGQVNVLKGIDLTIRSGDFVVITGPSGSGKSTLLHICALIDRPSSGTVVMCDTDLSEASEEDLCRMRKEKVGLVFQRFCLLPHRSALDNILFRFRYLDDPPGNAHDLASATMDQMGISAVSHRKARLLSSGEQQRVAIARAVVQKPELLLADEPTGNLDSGSSE